MAAVSPTGAPGPSSMSDPLLGEPSAPNAAPTASSSGVRAPISRLSGVQTALRGPVSIGSLIPVSPCPPLAFESRIQSVDIIAASPHILAASGRCGWSPCCSGANGPPFDWIALLHSASRSLSTAPSAAAVEGIQQHTAYSSIPPTEAATPYLSSDEHERAVQLLRALRSGTVPIGETADLSTLVQHNAVVFGGVKEVNSAYKSAWLCIYACLVLALLLAPLGWVLVLLLTISATVRRTLDEYVLYWMGQTCSKVNLLLFPCGVALMLLEGSAEPAAVSPDAAAALVDVELAQPYALGASREGLHGAKVWVLRVFMLPREITIHHNQQTEGSRDQAPPQQSALGQSTEHTQESIIAEPGAK
ncbi:transmembrane protein [Cyclospora cayetanensis]|uniref:Transmembrane protein n=1 Tax=Cyclospora cayetanensis TaxID=88456 RepID=A0A1D3CW99_9EIME|nr:transmembrane protein [Cyclospora cayetanensis]